MITSSLPALACQQWTIVSIIFSIQLSLTHSIIHLVSESVGHSFIHPLSFTHFDSRLTQQTQQNEIQLTDKLTSHFNVKLKFRNYAMRIRVSVWMYEWVFAWVCLWVCVEATDSWFLHSFLKPCGQWQQSSWSNSLAKFCQSLPHSLDIHSHIHSYSRR